MNIVILLGAPGSGKGTIAARLTSDTIAHLSSGDLLRGAIKNGTSAGCEAKAFMDKGELVPDALIAQMVDDYLDTDAKGLRTILLDGFPRTILQAEMLDGIMTKQGASLKCALLLDIKDEVVIARISSRCICSKCGAGFNKVILPPKEDGVCDDCGAALITRADDSPETVKHRLDVYAAQTFPLIAYYRDKGALRTIDANGEDIAVKVNLAQQEINE